MPRASLATLPESIIHEISAYLVPDYDAPAPAPAPGPGPTPTRRSLADLAALNRVCRRAYAGSSPALWAYVDWGFEYPWDKLRAGPAALIREIHVSQFSPPTATGPEHAQLRDIKLQDQRAAQKWTVLLARFPAAHLLLHDRDGALHIYIRAECPHPVRYARLGAWADERHIVLHVPDDGQIHKAIPIRCPEPSKWTVLWACGGGSTPQPGLKAFCDAEKRLGLAYDPAGERGSTDGVAVGLDWDRYYEAWAADYRGGATVARGGRHTLHNFPPGRPRFPAGVPAPNARPEGRGPPANWFGMPPNTGRPAEERVVPGMMQGGDAEALRPLAEQVQEAAPQREPQAGQVEVVVDAAPNAGLIEDEAQPLTEPTPLTGVPVDTVAAAHNPPAETGPADARALAIAAADEEYLAMQQLVREHEAAEAAEAEEEAERRMFDVPTQDPHEADDIWDDDPFGDDDDVLHRMLRIAEHSQVSLTIEIAIDCPHGCEWVDIVTDLTKRLKCDPGPWHTGPVKLDVRRIGFNFSFVPEPEREDARKAIEGLKSALHEWKVSAKGGQVGRGVWPHDWGQEEQTAAMVAVAAAFNPLER